MIGWAWALLVTAATLGLTALGDLISEEIRGWLDLAPRAILRLAAAQLPSVQRTMIYDDEWLPELCYVLRGAEARPITRLIIGTKFAVGLLIAARGIARTINRASLAPSALVVGVRTETTRVTLSFRGREMDVTEEVRARAAELSMSVEKLLEQPHWLNRLSDTVTAQLPIGDQIYVAHRQTLSPVMSAERPQAVS
jgi:hypothetical protein